MPTDLKQRIAEIRERWANIPLMDCGTSDTGKKCEAYLYEKEFPNTLIATMADLYDMPRLNALAQSKSDIDALITEIERLERENTDLEEHIKGRDSLLSCALIDCPVRRD